MSTTSWRKAVRSAIPYLLGVSSLICAAIIGNYLREGHDNKNGAYIAGLASALITFLGAIYARLREIETDKQNEKLLPLQAQNRELIGRLDTTLTGGDSFAAVYYPLLEGKRLMTIRHFGNQPLTNIRISVIAAAPVRVIDGLVYPSLPPGAIEPIKPVNFNVNTRIALQINFATLYSSWGQNLVCSNVGGELLFALRVWRFGPAKKDGIGTMEVLFEEVHPRYPRDGHGEVDWSFGNSIDIAGSNSPTEPLENMTRRSLQMSDPAPGQESPSTLHGAAEPIQQTIRS